MGYSNRDKITSIGNQRFWACSDCLYKVEITEEDEEEREKVETFQRLSLLDHLPERQDLELEEDYSLVKLQSGSLLYAGARSDDNRLEGFTIEIDPKTLEALKIWTMPEEENEYTSQSLNFKEFYPINGDLLLSVMRKKIELKEEEEEEIPKLLETNQESDSGKVMIYRTVKIIDENERGISYGLALWDKKLNLLDSNFEYDLRDLESIMTIDDQFVTARGADHNYVLFEIDAEAKKITVKKNLSIKTSWIGNLEKEATSPQEFACLVESNQGGRLLIKFNSKLDLVSWTKDHVKKSITRKQWRTHYLR